MQQQPRHESKSRILDAALQVIRTKGYTATTIDDVCHAADLTKGSFFHHFKSKEALALAAAEYFSAMAEELFARAPYRSASDPVDRLLGYVDFRAAILVGTVPEFTCLLGTMVQETYATHPAIRAVCDQGMASHIAELVQDVEAAKQLYAPAAAWSAESVGYFMQSVLQGAFIFAKARQSPDVVIASLEHLRRYLETLFDRQPRNESPKENYQ
jgi:TetR/AcrR family transcriptional regulator, transcriptional repressor for nem operon